MSQDVSSYSGVGQSFDPSISFQPWSVDSEADQLMDDLFLDLDQMLEDGTQLPTNPNPPEFVSLQSVVVPPIHLPSKPSVEPPAFTEPEEIPPQSQTVTSEKVIPNQKPYRLIQDLDKIIFGCACIALAGVILWLVSQERLNIPLLFNLVTRSNSAAQLSEADAEFIRYMQRSLSVMDRQEPGTAIPIPPQDTATVPPVDNSDSAIAPRVLERVYIPVYPPTPPQTSPPSVASPNLVPAPPVEPPAPPLPSPAPSVIQPAPPTPTPPPAPAPRQQAAPTPTPPPPAPAPRQQAAPTPTPPPPAPAPRQQAAPTPTPPPPAPTPPLPAPTPPAPVVNHRLVGLLELGERSAALFDVNGVTQRIRPGETISASGWVLVSIENQNAVIRRNGEVRSIFVGQSF